MTVEDIHQKKKKTGKETKGRVCVWGKGKGDTISRGERRKTKKKRRSSPSFLFFFSFLKNKYILVSLEFKRKEEKNFWCRCAKKKKRRELGKKKCGYKFEEQIKKKRCVENCVCFFFVTDYEKKKIAGYQSAAKWTKIYKQDSARRQKLQQGNKKESASQYQSAG